MNEKVVKKTPSEVISQSDRVFEINKLIEKALTFYCGKYKKKSNFKIEVILLNYLKGKKKLMLLKK